MAAGREWALFFASEVVYLDHAEDFARGLELPRVGVGVVGAVGRVGSAMKASVPPVLPTRCTVPGGGSTISPGLKSWVAPWPVPTVLVPAGKINIPHGEGCWGRGHTVASGGTRRRWRSRGWPAT